MKNDIIVYVSPEFFESLGAKSDLLSIVQSKLTKTFELKQKLWCISGSIGTGKGIGWDSHYAYQVVPFSEYKNEKVPMKYNDHFDDVGLGNRERCYDGILLTYNKEKIVLVGPEICIKCKTEKTTQGNLFN